MLQVDNFQEVSYAEYDLIHALSSQEGVPQRVTVTVDASQATHSLSAGSHTLYEVGSCWYVDTVRLFTAAIL